MNNPSDRRPQRPWNADKPEISTGSQHRAVLQIAPAVAHLTDMAATWDWTSAVVGWRKGGRKIPDKPGESGNHQPERGMKWTGSQLSQQS